MEALEIAAQEEEEVVVVVMEVMEGEGVVVMGEDEDVEISRNTVRNFCPNHLHAFRSPDSNTCRYGHYPSRRITTHLKC